MAEGDADGEELVSLFLVSFLVVSDFLVVVAASFFWVVDFLVVVLAGDFSGAVVVVAVSVLLVLQELIRPATNRTVME